MTDRYDLSDQLFPRSGKGQLDAKRAGKRKRTRRHVDADAAAVFSEEPVPLSVFVTDARFLNCPPLSPVQFEAVRHIEQIYLPATYETMVKEFGPAWKPGRLVNFIYLEWAKGAGKDFVCRVAAARVAYLLLCLKDPQDYFSMPRSDSIHLLNVAASEAQAKQAFFKPHRRLIRGAPWFADRFEMSSGGIVFDKGIELISGHSAAETQEGLNLILGIADEISAFRTDEEVAHLVKASGREPSGTAGGILKMMRTSGRTRFPETFKLVAISYPRFKGDAIQQLVDQGKEGQRSEGRRVPDLRLGTVCDLGGQPAHRLEG